MQVIGLVYNDDFLLRYNAIIPTDDFIERLSDFKPFFDSDVYDDSGFAFQMSWSWNYGTYFYEVLFKTGFCFTFNYPGSSEIFNLNKLVCQFEIL